MGTMDELINPTVVDNLRDSLRMVAPTLAFTALTSVHDEMPGKRLRRRVDLVRDALLTDLPPGFPAAQSIVHDLLAVSEFAGWMIWPTTEFVVARALEGGSVEDFDAAMVLLAQLTIGLTGEFAVRDLLIARPERALQTMRTWTAHEDEHVRRLATEGSRAYLPWAKRVPWLLTHPDATRGIIDDAYRDSAEYVRRSVANHLNDLSRVDPTTATRIGQGWADTPDANTPRVLRHGLRTLIKEANPAALAMLGYVGDTLRVDRPRVSTPAVSREHPLTFTVAIANEGDADAIVAIDYSIGFLRANGTVSPKTFKLASRRLTPGESVVVAKTHSFRPITTRTYYPGPHFVTVQANGVLSPPADFTLRQAGGGESTIAEGQETNA